MAPPSSSPVAVPRRPPPLTVPAQQSLSEDCLPNSVDCIAACISPLKDTVRAKWQATAERRTSTGGVQPTTPTSLAQRLAAADKRRENMRLWVVRRARGPPRRQLRRCPSGSAVTVSSTSDTENRLEDAEAVPRSTAEGVRSWRSRQAQAEANRRKQHLEARLAAAAERRARQLEARSKRKTNKEEMQPASTAAEPAAASSTRSLQRAWRSFVRERRTTAALSNAFLATGVLMPQDASADFDSFTTVLQMPRTLRATSKLLARLDHHLVRAGSKRCITTDHLLRRLFPACRAHGTVMPPRFPPRVVLCAFMITLHPSWVLRDPSAALERQLRDSAAALVSSLDAIVRHFTRTYSPGAPDDAKALLLAFETAWRAYLTLFVAWKTADAAGLERDLVDMAAALHASVLRKLGTSVVAAATSGQPVELNHDRQAILDGVRDDIALIQAKIAGLTGTRGVARLQAAIRAMTELVAEEEINARASEVAAAANLNNERILHELLLDPEWRLPRDTTAGDHGAIRATVERAFWSRVLEQTDIELLATATGMLYELKSELLAVAPARLRETLTESLTSATAAAESDGLAGIGAAIRAFSDAFKALCSPARREALEVALRELHAAEGALAEQPQGSSASERSRIVVSALRMLHDQLMALKRDIANAQVALLVPVAVTEAGLSSARAKFAARHGLEQQAASSAAPPQEALPKTRAFLAAASQVLATTVVPELRDEMLGARGDDASRDVYRTAPMAMHTGLRATTQVSPGLREELSSAFPGVPSLRCPECLIRIGVVDILSSSTRSDALPEILDLDGECLAACAAQFDTCILTAAVLLLMPQLRAPGMRSEDAASLVQRLGAVLTGDAAVGGHTARIAHAAAELARVCNCEPASAERLLTKMTAAGSSARGVLTAAMCRTLRALLVVGSSRGASLANAALTRAGAAALLPDMEALAAKLQRVCAVADKVHGVLLQRLLEDALDG